MTHKLEDVFDFAYGSEDILELYCVDETRDVTTDPVTIAEQAIDLSPSAIAAIRFTYSINGQASRTVLMTPAADQSPQPAGDRGLARYQFSATDLVWADTARTGLIYGYVELEEVGTGRRRRLPGNLRFRAKPPPP